MNKTRWNSMFNMLNSLLKVDDRNILEQLPPLSFYPPKNFKMNILSEVCEILQPISLFTNEMQATHGTSGMIIPEIEMILNELDEGDLALVYVISLKNVLLILS